MPVKCGQCGKEVADGKRFCSSCGTEIAEPRPHPEPEAEPAPDKRLFSYLKPESPIAQHGGPVEAPGFEIKSVHTSSNTDPDIIAEAELESGIFKGRPWLIYVICFGILGIMIISAAISISTASHHQSRDDAYVSTPAGKISTATSAACNIKVAKSAGDISYLPRAGAAVQPLKPGTCLNSGAAVFTGRNGRVLVTLAGLKVAVNANANSSFSVSFNEGSNANSPATVHFQTGEIWMDVKSAISVDIDTGTKTTIAAGPGGFHFLTKFNTKTDAYESALTPASGTIIFHDRNGDKTVAPGMQLLANSKIGAVAIRQIYLERFLTWVNEWKDDFTPPKPPSSAASSGQPNAGNEEKYILEALVNGYPVRLPDYMKMSVKSKNDTWAIATIKDSRPDAASLQDFQPSKAALLRKNEGHWMFLEEFDDYNEEFYQEWTDKWGFDKKAEAALGLSY